MLPCLFTAIWMNGDEAQEVATNQDEYQHCVYHLHMHTTRWYGMVFKAVLNITEDSRCLWSSG